MPKTQIDQSASLKRRHSIDLSGPSRTHQSFKAECDINTIMAKYEKHALLEHVNAHNGQYGDFLNLPDFHTSQLLVLQARESFDSLPSSIRKRFHNDPGEFMSFAQDPSNEDEMRKLGLLPPIKPDPIQTKDGTPEAGKTSPAEPEAVRPGSVLPD